jgi:serine/threonine-protein kinase
MAVVQLAHDRELDRPVAIKLLADNLAGDPGFRLRFLREGQIAARLSHPNVVQVFDVGDEGGRPYIVMEYVEGETLAERLVRLGRLPPAEVVDLGLQVAAGLAHAHAAGLVHRDVNPRNLLLRRDGTVKIADFGIARPLDDSGLTQTGAVLGTMAYLAPEQARGLEVTTAVDCYALGAVLYEAVGGRPAYAAASLAGLIEAQQAGAIAPPEGAPPWLAERPSASEIAAELRAAPEARATVPLLPTATAVLRRPSRYRVSRRARAALIGGAAGATALGLALASIGGGHASRHAPPPAPPISPAAQARDLARWLRAHG